MTIDSLSEIVSTSLSIPDLSKLTATDREKSQGHKKAVASLIPYVGGAAAEELQQYRACGVLPSGGGIWRFVRGHRLVATRSGK